MEIVLLLVALWLIGLIISLVFGLLLWMTAGVLYFMAAMIAAGATALWFKIVKKQ